MLSYREAYNKSRDILGKIYDVSEAEAICSFLFNEKFGISRTDILSKGDLIFQYEDLLNDCMEKLSKMEPVQHIVGYGFFMGMKVLVGPEALIPRPETEELLELVFRSEKNPSVAADICSGSGCIALALRKRYDSSKIYGLDISASAIKMARESEINNFGNNHIIWLQHDILNTRPPFEDAELIVCNPPYIKISESNLMQDNVLKFEPEIALFVYDDDPLLFYKHVLKLPSRVKSRRYYFELNPLTANNLEIWCRDNGFDCELQRDMSGKQRFAVVKIN